MSQHDFVIDNQNGASFRSDLNNAIAAIISLSSGTSAPATTYAYQFWIDTTNTLLKIRNAANSAWITIGAPNAVNLGLLSLAGGTLTGALIASSTDAWTVPAGTTAQRPGSPAVGMVRWNSDLSTYEGYNGSAFAAIGGGGLVITAVQTVTAAGSITTTTTDNRQLRHIKGSSGGVTASTTPFGTGGGWKDGTEILLVGNSDSDTVTFTFTDSAKGLVGNFTTLEITNYATALCVYSSSLDRWILTNR